ncbi:MAG: DUF502 domain-containing protein [Planctomycetota bacterium]
MAEKASRRGGVRRAVVRGLGVVLPPLLTIVVLLWAWNAIESYVLRPVETGMQWVLVQTFADMPSEIPPTAIQNERGFTYEGVSYVPDPTGRRYLPGYVVQRVEEVPDQFGANAAPLNTARAYWQRYVSLQYLPRTVVVPVFLILFLTLLYFLGRLFAGGLGRWFVTAFDSAILRIPIVNKVYGSVKQITDFAFDDREIEFNRVVAIQYPRKGIWSLGFVTGNSLREISEAAGEPMLSVLMPTSPMPMTGFTVTVRRSEAIDLELTIDEAIQFIVSCGVVVPPQQRIGGNGEAATTPPSLQLPASTSATSVPSIDSHP